MRASSRGGIPIGPDFGHLLGQVALEDNDKSLHSAFGERYLRYVDDLVVVCPNSEIDSVRSQIAVAVEEGGFKIHKGKDDVVDSSVWRSDCPIMDENSGEHTFNALIRDLTVYLMLRPELFDSLRATFKAEGFSIPFLRLKVQSNYGPLRRFIQYQNLAGIVDSVRLYFWKESNFVEKARGIRDELRISLKRLLADSLPVTGMRRRWFAQKCKYHFNRLMYLLPKSDYQELRELIPDGSEFAENRILLESLMRDDVNEIAKLPGRAVSLYCELAAEHGPPKKSPWSDLDDRAKAESATAMALYFGWEFASNETATMYTGSQTLLQACSLGVEDRSQIVRLSYLDEMELLLRGTNSKERKRYVRTRSNDNELIGLGGLWLGERSEFS